MSSRTEHLTEAFWMGLACSVAFILPAACGGKLALFMLFGVPLGFLGGGIAGYVLSVQRGRKSRPRDKR
jgi:hypothetical protein